MHYEGPMLRRRSASPRSTRRAARPTPMRARVLRARVLRARAVLARAALVVSALAAPSLPAQAPALPDGALRALRWRLVGPFRAGRVLTVAGVPGDPATFYFGAVDGGVWKTTNAGVTWDPIFDDQPIASIGAIAVAPSDPRVIWVGTGEADMRSDITHGAGIYRSTDGGAHWTHLGLDDTRQIGRILVDPHDANVALVAALGHAYGPNEERGVLRTTDGGRTWAKVLYRNPDVGAIDLAADPETPNVVYAALWQARRTPWSQYPPNEGPGSALYRSVDGGVTWTQIGHHGLPSTLGRMGLAVAPGSHAQRVYALVDAPRDGGLYRSDDGGATWRLAGPDPRVVNRGWYFGRVTVDPTNPDVVYVPNVSLLRSTDGGATFTPIRGAPGGDDYHDLWIDPRDPSHMVCGVDQGTIVTLDGARTWSSWYNQPTAQFYHVVTDNQFPYHIYGAQQDAGTVDISSRANDGLITFRDWHPVGAGESGYIAPDPRDANIVYGGDTYGGLFRFDRVTGQSQNIAPWPLSAFGTPMPKRKYRFTWTSPIVFDRHDPSALYFGAQQLLVTRDGGLHWSTMSPDLTGARADAQRADGDAPPTVETAAAQGWGVIYTIAPSPARAGVIWVGTDDGLIQLTTDGGKHWTNVTPPSLTPWSKVSLIDASALSPAVAYAAIDRHRLDDFAPHILRTRDFGKHWQEIDDGILAGAFVRAVRADPVRKGLLFAGTELGVYVSLDDGDHWRSLQLNLPTVAIHDLVVHDADLVVATHGRSFWVLDDVSPLRQMSEVTADRAHVFRPARAVRIRRSTNNDTPLPPEEPHGENPPAGAVIDYWLPSATTAPVTLEILDAAGRVVRRVTSDSTPTRPAGAPQIAREWLPSPERLTRDAGLNRFVWDLRYPAPPVSNVEYSIAGVAGRGTVALPEGPLALPGGYRVRLRAAGESFTQPLTLAMDPRVHVTSAALAAQRTLALEIWNAIADEHALHERASALASALRSLAEDSLEASSRSAADSLAHDVAAILAGTETGDLQGLEGAVESADREPTRQDREAFTAARGTVRQLQSQWSTRVKRRVAQVNATLAAEHRPALPYENGEVQHLTIPR